MIYGQLFFQTGPVVPGDVEKGSKSVADSNLGEILPVYRQDSHLAVQSGSHEFPGEGTYQLKFDNSYSLWRNKTLYYRVYYSAWGIKCIFKTKLSVILFLIICIKLLYNSCCCWVVLFVLSKPYHRSKNDFYIYTKCFFKWMESWGSWYVQCVLCGLRCYVQDDIFHIKGPYMFYKCIVWHHNRTVASYIRGLQSNQGKYMGGEPGQIFSNSSKQFKKQTRKVRKSM